MFEGEWVAFAIEDLRFDIRYECKVFISTRELTGGLQIDTLSKIEDLSMSSYNEFSIISAGG